MNKNKRLTGNYSRLAAGERSSHISVLSTITGFILPMTLLNCIIRGVHEVESWINWSEAVPHSSRHNPEAHRASIKNSRCLLRFTASQKTRNGGSFSRFIFQICCIFASMVLRFVAKTVNKPLPACRCRRTQRGLNCEFVCLPFGARYPGLSTQKYASFRTKTWNRCPDWTLVLHAVKCGTQLTSFWSEFIRWLLVMASKFLIGTIRLIWVKRMLIVENQLTIELNDWYRHVPR